MREVFFIAAAGALGALSRFGVCTWSSRVFGDELPIGTLLVNVLGSLVLGFVMQLGFSAPLLPVALRVPVAVGFLGAFTTFSTFSYETMRFIEAGDWRSALANMGANLVLCLLATGAGFLLGRAVVPSS